MFKLWFFAAGFVLCTVLPSTAHEKPALETEHYEAVKLSDRQVEAGNFAITKTGSGFLSRRISVPGSIVPSGDHIARVAVRLLGTIAELRKRLGDPVEAGEVVAVIESREVADAKSDYLGARLVFDLQQTLFNRSKTLYEGKVLSENDYLRARTTFEDARVKIESARQKLFALSLTSEQIDALPNQPVATLRRQELRAPIAGRIAERRADLGSLVGREGQESEVYVIVDSSIVWAELTVAPSDLPSIQQGQKITISAGQNGATTPAVVLFVSPLLDKDTRSARVVASIDNPDGAWRPGAFVTAQIPTGEIPVKLTVPKNSIQTVKGESTVFVRTATGFEARKITTGRSDSGFVEVLSDLGSGEPIATANTFVLKADLGKYEATHQD